MTHPTVPAPRCATTSAGLDEPVLGTASVVRTWLLLEHPGSWPSQALRSRGLAAGIGAELARRANRSHVRVVLVRRPGRTAPGQPLTCFGAATGPAGSWLGRVVLDRLDDVLDLDLAELAAGRREAFADVQEPIFCVCTHGSHDPCCAERGRPVARALAGRWPDRTWEVSHIGGDRFAGNVVCFPGGAYLGRLDATNAVPVLEAFLEGTYALDHLRGRAGFVPAVQAGEVLVRRELGITTRGGVRVVGGVPYGDHVLVQLELAGQGRIAAVVEVAREGPARRLTCTAGRDTAPPVYRLVGLIGVRP